MKDEHDNKTVELFKGSRQSKADHEQKAREKLIAARREAEALQVQPVALERGTEGAAPQGQTGRPALRVDARFVPVSFVAKDWDVTPRRIRALLTAGRLAGRQQGNGYWEVQHPYLLALGTRGPSLNHQKRPPKRPRLVVDNTAGKSA